MRRRTFVVGTSCLALCGFARPDALLPRTASFEEIGPSVRMTLRLPDLFRKHDEEALASIDSGFDTTIEYTLRVWKWGTKRELIETKFVTVKIRRDPWKKRYVVRTNDDRGWTKRYFDKRSQAIKAAVSLSRVRITSTEALERGGDRGPFYFVEVLAMRNPLRKRDSAASRSSSGRGQGRDLEWFGRLVAIFAGERAKAEEIVHIRTQPFYLELP